MELFGAPLSLSEIPIRFSADANDGAFGFRHDSLQHDDGTPRDWALLAQECLAKTARLEHRIVGPHVPKLVCLYANVEYLTQLRTLLAYARTMLDTGEKHHLAIRLFAIFPVGHVKAAIGIDELERSGGTLLTLHGHSCYDFIPYRHWLGRAHSNAAFSHAAPIQVGLARWETSVAAMLHAMTARECEAVREWAMASSLRNPALPKPRTQTDDPSPNLSFHIDLKTHDMLYHERLRMWHLPPQEHKQHRQDAAGDPEPDSDEEGNEPANRSPLETPEVLTEHWPPHPTVTASLYGPLLPQTEARCWDAARLHFLGVLPQNVIDGLRLNGLSDSDVADTLNIVSRSRILAGAAAWHAHGKSHPQDTPDPKEQATPNHHRQDRAPTTLPSAPAPATTGTPNVVLGEDFTPRAAPYVNPTDATREQYRYHWRKVDARTQAGRNPKMQGITTPTAAADRDALARHMRTARHFTARIALPPYSQEQCDCGHPGYRRHGNIMCAPCRLASHHYGEHAHQAHARRHMCAHCQVCGADDPAYTIAGLTWACHACASHIAGTMAPQPQYSYELPKACADCGNKQTPRFGLDGRPLCLVCQDPPYPAYLAARAGIIVQDYLDVCHDIRRVIPVNAHTTPALLALARLLPQDPRHGLLFQPTSWRTIETAVHTLARLVAMNVELPLAKRSCTTAPHRLLYNQRDARMVHCAHDYGTLANHTLLATRAGPAGRGTKRQHREKGPRAAQQDSLEANRRRMQDEEREAQPQGRRNPRRRRALSALSDSGEDTNPPPRSDRRDQAAPTPGEQAPTGARAPALSVVTPPPPPPPPAHTAGTAGSGRSSPKRRQPQPPHRPPQPPRPPPPPPAPRRRTPQRPAPTKPTEPPPASAPPAGGEAVARQPRRTALQRHNRHDAAAAPPSQARQDGRQTPRVEAAPHDAGNAQTRRRPGTAESAPRRKPRHRQPGARPTAPPKNRRQGRTAATARDPQGGREWGTSLFRDPGATLSRVAGRSVRSQPCPTPGDARNSLMNNETPI